jgi:hypothetical protein
MPRLTSAAAHPPISPSSTRPDVGPGFSKMLFCRVGVRRNRPPRQDDRDRSDASPFYSVSNLTWIQAPAARSYPASFCGWRFSPLLYALLPLSSAAPDPGHLHGPQLADRRGATLRPADSIVPGAARVGAELLPCDSRGRADSPDLKRFCAWGLQKLATSPRRKP